MEIRLAVMLTGSEAMKKLLKNAGVLFAFCLGILLILELALRILFPLPEGKPYVTEVKQNLPGIKSSILYSVNPFGFRALKMHSKNKPPHTLRVLCLGASTTEQSTQSNEDIWCSLLEQKLEKQWQEKGIRVETAAFGMGGHRIRDTLAWAQQHLMEFPPDLVILLQGINDLVWNGGPAYRIHGPPSIHWWQSLNWEWFQIFRRAHLAYIHLQKMWKSVEGGILEWHSALLPGLRQKRQALPLVKNPVRDPDPIEEFRLNLEAFLQFTQNHQLPTLVLGQPVFWKEPMSEAETAMLWFRLQSPQGEIQAPPAWLNGEMERYNRLQARLASQYGADYMNLNGVVPKDSRHFIDDCHFTDLGNEVLATAILPRVQGILQARPLP